MNTSQFCTLIDLPDAITDHDLLKLHDRTPYRIPPSSLNPVILDILSGRGFVVNSVEIFRAGPGNPKLKIHVDDSPVFHNGFVHNDIGKLNWTYGYPDCNVKWYKQREGTSRKLGVNGFSVYTEFAEEDVEEIASINIGRNAILQAGIPHNVENHSGHDWFCLGIHLGYPGFNIVPYAFLVKKFRDYVKKC